MMISGMSGKAGRGWTAIGNIVTGAKHLLQETPCCQDALYIYPDNTKFVVACVADGHGSLACPYSDEGAKIAVNLAGELLVSILNGDALNTLYANKDIWLPKQIETQWKDRVRALHSENGREEITPFPYVLYGTTLLAIAVSDNFAFALQIGDGDILMVDENGLASHILEVADSLGEATESLCLDDAWKYINTRIISLNADMPNVMFILSTDGYANSFIDTQGLIKAGTDFFTILQEEGLDYIDEKLPLWLREASDNGSGDDIAMSLIVYDGSH